MDYTLRELSQKMGFEAFDETGERLYYYNRPENSKLGGFAEIRLEEEGNMFSASLYHCRGNYEDDSGAIHKDFEESVEIRATRVGEDRYRIIYMELDAAKQPANNAAMAELGMSIFHSRIVDIQDGMAAQSFGTAMDSISRRDDRYEEQAGIQSAAIAAVEAAFRDNKAMTQKDTASGGIVIAFPGRRAQHGRMSGV
ncbi:MAG: hypothetical protein EA357_06005 [Micavibrio sp.]|nr:MAG: hypothetical protein EA357_06005 [Micavibrio sp.]